MAKMMDTISTINTTIRTFLALLVAVVLGFASYFGYNVYHEKELALQVATSKVEALNVEVAQKREQIEKLEVRLKLLKVDRRIGQFYVIDQKVDPESGKMISKIRFVEVDPNGQMIGAPREFTVKGKDVYIDYWVVKFDDQYVEENDPFRNTSIYLFRKIFGDAESPDQVENIDTPGDRPLVYGKSPEASKFEDELWSDFWKLANDRKAAQERGVRGAHGEAVHVEMIKGKTYELELRSSGGINLIPIDNPTKPQS